MMISFNICPATGEVRFDTIAIRPGGTLSRLNYDHERADDEARRFGDTPPPGGYLGRHSSVRERFHLAVLAGARERIELVFIRWAPRRPVDESVLENIHGDILQRSLGVQREFPWGNVRQTDDGTGRDWILVSYAEENEVPLRPRRKDRQLKEAIDEEGSNQEKASGSSINARRARTSA